MVALHEELEARRRTFLKRRRIIWLVSVGVVVLLILFYALFNFTDIFSRVSGNAQSVPRNSDWVMFHRDPGHTGNTGTDSVLPEGTLKWTFSTGAAISSSPAVVDGLIYIGSRDTYIYALNADTGDLSWKFKTGSWVDSSPVVVNGVVYVGSNDGNLYALDAKTGHKLWAFPVKYAVRSTPAVAGEVVYFGSDDYGVYAVDAAAGTEVWHKKTDGAVKSSPVIVDGVVMVGAADGICYTFNAENGGSRLEYDTKAAIVSSPAVKDGVAYIVDTRGFFWAIDIMARNWLFENKIKAYWNVLYLYGIAPRPPMASGYIWHTSLGWGIKTGSSPAVADNNVYLGAGDSVLSIDITTQQVQWTFHTGGMVTSTPAIAGTALYVGSQDGKLYAIDRATGEKLWESATGDMITSSPAVASGMVFVGSQDGKLYAFK